MWEPSSDIQLEVRRQLNEVMSLHEEESRRLRAQVEALVAENYELRMSGLNDVQGRQPTSRPWLVTSGGFPGLGWLGRGLGSIIGGSPPPPPTQPLDLRGTQALDLSPIPPPPPPPVTVAEQGSVKPSIPPESSMMPVRPVVPKNQGSVPPKHAHTLVPMHSEELSHEPANVLGTAQDQQPGADDCQRGNPPVSLGVGLGPKTSGAPGSEDSQIDPMNVVLTGMAQLQGLVTELATTAKGPGKPELVKPGSVALPELPLPGPEGCLMFADWLHDSKPALADISDTSEVLWQTVLDECDRWYKGYLRLGPMDRLVSRPTPPSSLQDPKWSRVSRRIESMIISAAPTVVRQELSAARISGLLNVVARLFCIYGPGGLAERELGLKQIQEPPVASTIQEVIDGLRKWRRWCHRMAELGGALPDSAIRVRALTKITKQVLPIHPEISFRINLVRAELQVDLTPTDDKVDKLHGQLLSEFEAINNRKEREQERERANTSVPPAKIKGVETAEVIPQTPKHPKTPNKAAPKPPNPPAKSGAGGEGASSGRLPCSFYVALLLYDYLTRPPLL